MVLSNSINLFSSQIVVVFFLVYIRLIKLKYILIIRYKYNEQLLTKLITNKCITISLKKCLKYFIGG